MGEVFEQQGAVGMLPQDECRVDLVTWAGTCKVPYLCSNPAEVTRIRRPFVMVCKVPFNFAAEQADRREHLPGVT
jgi:hypothetical protein